MNSIIFNSYKIGGLTLRNRIVRSATFEGAADEKGYPNSKYMTLYKSVAEKQIGMIITGFAFVSGNGRAMQWAQAGIDTSKKILSYRKITDEVHKHDVPIILQIAHSGRQTIKKVTNSKIISSTKKSSVYFRQKPSLINDSEIKEVIGQFTNAAYLAMEAGFDGVQLHAAHGYLLHQFLLPETNVLRNKYGIDKETQLGTKLLEEIFDSIKARCGTSFPVLIKISGGHNLGSNFFPDQFDNLIRFLDGKHFDAIEISYGTMDYAVNIFRGDLNLELVFKHNPIFLTDNPIKKYLMKLYINTFISPKFIDFSPAYNLRYAERAKQLTSIPVISVGGFRCKSEIENAINNKQADLVGMARPFICEPDFAEKLAATDGDYKSRCINCNKCVFMCDSGKPTNCYSKG